MVTGDCQDEALNHIQLCLCIFVTWINNFVMSFQKKDKQLCHIYDRHINFFFDKKVSTASGPVTGHQELVAQD
jgi:hypothetical protein